MYTLQSLKSEEQFTIFPVLLSDNSKVLSWGFREREVPRLMSVVKGAVLFKVCDCLKSSLYN